MIWMGTSVKVELVEFAKRAHAYFVANPEKSTFSKGNIEAGELLAVRWSYDRADPRKTWSVLVFEVGSSPILVEEFDTDGAL